MVICDLGFHNVFWSGKSLTSVTELHDHKTVEYIYEANFWNLNGDLLIEATEGCLIEV